jgi:hypothetical protein
MCHQERGFKEWSWIFNNSGFAKEKLRPTLNNGSKEQGPMKSNILIGQELEIVRRPLDKGIGPKQIKL